MPLANEPVIRHQIESLRAMGISELAVVISENLRAFADEIEAVARRCGKGVGVRIVVTGNMRGSAGAIHDAFTQLEERWNEGQPVLIFSGGMLPNAFDLEAACQAHRQNAAGLTVFLRSNVTHQLVELDDQDRVLRVRVTHPSEDYNWSSCGLYLAEPEIFRMLPNGKYADIREQLIPLLNQKNIRVHGIRHDAEVDCLDSISDYMSLCKQLTAERVRKSAHANALRAGVIAGEGTTIATSAVVLGPVVFGSNCCIGEGAIVIGPASLGDGCYIGRNGVVRESVLWENARVENGGRLEFSLLGKNCSLPAEEHVCGAIIVDEADEPLSAYEHPFLSEPVYVNRRGRLFANGEGIKRQVFRAFKRAIDVVGGGSGMLMLTPLLLLIALAVKLDSRGPAIFMQQRVGMNGKVFTMYKFRSMRTGADLERAKSQLASDVDGPMFKMYRDPRITRIGRVLRATSLDELPQLFNVVKGDMSLVGPRPLVMAEMSGSPAWRDWRLMVRPGMTGLWQVSGRSATGFSEWIRFDVAYVREQSLWTDVSILARTCGAVFRRAGAA